MCEYPIVERKLQTSSCIYQHTTAQGNIVPFTFFYPPPFTLIPSEKKTRKNIPEAGTF